MPLPPFIRNPELKERVDLAYEQALRAQSELGGAAVGGAMSMQAGIDALNKETTAAREAGTIPGSRGLELITNPEIKQAFEAALANADKLFVRIGLTTPTIEQLQSAGVDLTHLATGYERMEARGEEPQIVLAPVMTKDEAKELYSHLTNDSTIPNNPLKKYDSTHTSGDGIWINEEITGSVWDNLHDPTTSPLTNSDSTKLPIYTDPSSRRWTLRIIAGTEKPTETNISYQDHPHGNSSISEYLSLQALRIQAGETPVDANTYTWNNGIFNSSSGSSAAAYGYWDVDRGRVYVNQRDVSNADSDLGVRSSVG